MKITNQIKNQIGILSIEGDIISQTVAELKDYFETFVEKEHITGIILDCEKAEYIDSAGLGLIASFYKTLMQLNKKFAIASVNVRMMESFTLTNLNNIFTITKDIQAAIDFMS